MLSFYKAEWNATFDGTDEALEKLLSLAEDVVNQSIYLSGYTVETVPERLRPAVHKAVCAQADYIESCGGVESMTEGTYSSVSLGKFSYSGGGSASSESASGASLCVLAERYLLPTGLLYRGVTVL